MTDYLSNARDAIQRARETTDQAVVREQLDSLEEGLNELVEGDKTQESNPAAETDRLKQIEKKLMGLLDETGSATAKHLRDARDELDAFRQEHGDWET